MILKHATHTPLNEAAFTALALNDADTHNYTEGSITKTINHD
ncbi:hypothetical protein [Hwangdonia sp.]